MPNRSSVLGLTIALLALAAAWTVPSQAFDDELTGEHLVALLPEEVDAFTLDQVNAQDSDAAVHGVYQPEGEGEPINIQLAYGEDAGEQYRQVRARLVQAEMDTEDLPVQDRTFTAARAGNDFIALAFFDQFFVLAGYENLDADVDWEALESTLVAFLEAFDPDRLAEWTPPEGLDYAIEEVEADVTDCYDMKCFGEHVSRCAEAQIIVPGPGPGRNLMVMYTVEGPADNDQCQLSLVFTDNPNPDFEDTPLYFTIDPDADWEEVGRDVVEECFGGDREAYNCEGPLLELMQ